MSLWKTTYCNENQIKAETKKAVLVAMPSKSEYKGYAFWHPSKLVQNGKASCSVKLMYTDCFEFRLKKYGQGKNNKYSVVSEDTITAAELEEAFSSVYISEKNEESYLVISEPEKLFPEKVEVLDELRNV